MSTRLLICCAVLAVWLPTFDVSAAEVYRSIDANGVVTYSDRPEAGAELVIVASSAPAQAASAPTTAAAAADSEPEVLSGERRREPTAAETAQERARNCSVAQERTTRYGESQRLFRNLPNGEREYLSDSEVDTARAQAEADVANWCD
jgi:hypothetical protein